MRFFVAVLRDGVWWRSTDLTGYQLSVATAKQWSGRVVDENGLPDTTAHHLARARQGCRLTFAEWQVQDDRQRDEWAHPVDVGRWNGPFKIGRVKCRPSDAPAVKLAYESREPTDWSWDAWRRVEDSGGWFERDE